MRTINISCSSIGEENIVAYLRQLPGGKPMWGDWRFIFNADDVDYDYLAVLHNLHAPLRLRCPPENTIHITREPPSVKRYEHDFLAQFGTVITQDVKVRHPGRILNQSGLVWLLGLDVDTADQDRRILNFEELKALFERPRSKLVSVISSSKSNTPGHAKRLRFVKALKQRLGNQIDLFGHELAPVRDKAEALLDYRFHVALENSSYDHYFSEKLTDCFMAGCYPIYCGCPNIGSYFPDKSMLQVDIDNPDAALAAIQKCMAEDHDRKYRQHMQQARDLVMHEFGMLPMLVNIITAIEQGKHSRARPVLKGDHMLPYDHPTMRPIYKLPLVKMWLLNPFHTVVPRIQGYYLRRGIRKLMDTQQAG